jgi:ADP-ribose pyrophosphatase YjhB (NUDIX family)
VTGRSASPPSSADPRGELPHSEFEEIYSKVPRLTVEVVVQSPLGILLTKRASGPCSGLWHIPGGTVRFGEPIRAAVSRVAAMEIGLELHAGPLLGYIEYPSHYLHGMDSPVGLAFLCQIEGEQFINAGVEHGWFTEPPEPMHAEQVAFLAEHGLLISKR